MVDVIGWWTGWSYGRQINPKKKDHDKGERIEKEFAQHPSKKDSAIRHNSTCPKHPPNHFPV